MPIVDNCTGYWKLNDSSTTALDAIGVNNGTWTGTPSWQAGKIGGAALFDGSTNYISMGNVLDQTSANAFSCSLWFKSTAAAATTYNMAGKILFTGSFAGWQMGFNTTTGGAPDAGKIGVVIVDAATTVARRQSTATYNDGNWHHFVFTYDGSKTRAGMLMYIDNVQPTYSDTDSASWAGSTTNSVNFEIGARDGLNQPFPGTVDEVGFFNVALTATNVDSLYNQGFGRTYPFSHSSNMGRTIQVGSGMSRSEVAN